MNPCAASPSILNFLSAIEIWFVSNLFNYSFHFLRFEKRFFFVPFELIVDTQNSLVEGIVSPTAIFLKVLHDCIPSSPFLVAVKIVMLIIA